MTFPFWALNQLASHASKASPLVTDRNIHTSQGKVIFRIVPRDHLVSHDAGGTKSEGQGIHPNQSSHFNSPFSLRGLGEGLNPPPFSSGGGSFWGGSLGRGLRGLLG